MYTANRIVPELVTDTSLKRSRIDNSDGTSSIRVSNTTEPVPVDLSTLETNTGDIKNYSQTINDKVGFKTDAAWDGETTNPSMISLLKKTASNSVDLSSVTTPLGTTEDTSSDSTVIGLLKSISSKLQ